jgi:hypothetical protein
MKITDEAKLILQQEFISNNSDCLKASLQKSCCGTSLVFNMIKLKASDKPVFVNGIQVMMDNKAQARAETVTIAVENGELIIQDDAASSCCG